MSPINLLPQHLESSPRCLVLGGSGVIGEQVCRALAAAGARVVFTYRAGAERAETLRQELSGSVALALDLADAAQVAAAIDRAASELGGLDALVQCAGIAAVAPDREADCAVEQLNAEQLREMIAINVSGVFSACRAAVPHMRRAGGGNIVLIGSIDAKKPMPSPVHYALTQGALRTMVAALAKDVGPASICVNLIAAGLLSDGLSRIVDDEARAEYIKHCALKRLGEPIEVARVMSWFALRNSYVTGQTIAVDGHV